jgi:predicted RNA-binding Zn ribbon-like protein
MKPKHRPVKSPASFDWQGHHFISRTPALDFANTVVYRNRPDRRRDRLAAIADIERWRRHADAGLGRPLGPLGRHLQVREAIDRFFREAAAGEVEADALRALMRFYARHAAFHLLHKTPLGIRAGPRLGSHRRSSFLAGILQSAVELAFSPDLARVKACPACGWLFIDRTRNRSKRWCITALCGNRSKMYRHYRRRRAKTSMSP